MRRAIRVSLAAAALAASLAAVPARAQSVINAIGLIDYSTKPTFKVGDWARYKMTASSELGEKDDYTLTILIAGEEDFWGDPGFWVETWVDLAGQPPRVRASLVSYTIFSDTAAIQRLLLYTRKIINLLNEDGTPRVDINKPASSTLKARHEVMNPVSWSKEDLGTDTVSFGGRTVTARKVLMRQGKGVTQSVGDSTVYTELREDRTSWYANEVPITHLVREDIVTTSARRTWLIGRSGDAAALNIRDRGVGTAMLLEHGHGGLVARMVPEKFRKSLAAQQAAERRAAAMPAAATKR